MKHIKFLFLALLFLMLFSVFAEAASVTGTFTTDGTASATIFVPAGQKVRVQLTGTFVATVNLQRSNNNGLAYETVDSFNTTTSQDIPALTFDAIYRWMPTAYTSGTVSYRLDNVVYSANRSHWPVVPLNGLALTTFGSPMNPLVAGTVYVTDIYVSGDTLVTGIGVLNGTTAGTDKIVVWLFDESGLALGSSTLSGTTSSGANAWQEIALTATIRIKAGHYLIGYRQNGTTATPRFQGTAATGFGDAMTTSIAHSNAQVGSFGSTIYAITPGTAYTAGQGPLAYLY